HAEAVRDLQPAQRSALRAGRPRADAAAGAEVVLRAGARGWRGELRGRLDTHAALGAVPPARAGIRAARPAPRALDPLPAGADRRSRRALLTAEAAGGTLGSRASGRHREPARGRVL